MSHELEEDRRGDELERQPKRNVSDGAHEPLNNLDATELVHDSESLSEIAVPVEVTEPGKEENAVLAYLKRFKGAGQKAPPFFQPQWDAIPAAVLTAITLMVLAVIESQGLQPYNKGLLSYLPSFGASCTLVMYLVTSPGSQPRALILTHVMGAFLGVSWAHITKSLPNPLGQLLACAFAVAMITVLMMITGTMQPSASATTCLAALHEYGAMNDQGFMFMVCPALLGGCVICFLGWIMNNLVPWRHCYPVWY